MLVSAYSVTMLTNTPSLPPHYYEISTTEIVVIVPEALF
jgi:hypothetical protein